MKTPKEFTEEYTNLTANGIKPSLLYLEEQVYKLMQAYVNYVKVNNVVLDDVMVLFKPHELWRMAQKYNCDDFTQMIEQSKGLNKL